MLLSVMHDWISNNWLTIAVFLLGALTTWIAYVFAKKDKVPRYAVRNVCVIQGSEKRFPDLDIHYKGYGENLANFSVARVAFWNAGRETIDKKDVVKLAIELDQGCVVLDTSVLQSNSAENKFQCTTSKERNRVTIAFEFLDRNQGAVLEVLHTGVSRNNLKVVGTIKGVPGNPHRFVEGMFGGRPPADLFFRQFERFKSAQSRKKLLISMGLLVTAFLLGNATWNLQKIPWQGNDNPPPVETPKPSFYVFQAVGSILLAIPYVWMLFSLYRYTVPRGLEKYYEPI